MIRVLFFIHDLGQGGAEKVLLNLVNGMDKTKFDITVMTLFSGGVNEQFLAQHIHYKSVFKREFPANSRILKIFTPEYLHRKFIKDYYDIEVSYLEGPTARIISGCQCETSKLVNWIHCIHKDKGHFSSSFRNYNEALKCYNSFHYTACVAEDVKNNFLSLSKYKKTCNVLFNTIDSKRILELSIEPVDITLNPSICNIITTGTLKEVKGYDRLLRVIKRLNDESIPLHLFILGKGPLEGELKQFVNKNHLNDIVTFLGYHINPYKYLSKMDLFVCSSYSEGFSTAVTEALILGNPVVTTLCSGMQELLGENNEYGIITENNEDALYEGIKEMLTTPGLLNHYAEKALERGKEFSTEKTTRAVEEMLLSL